MHKFDYIIVGSGLAGLYTAWKASSKGRVAIITKALVRDSNSFNAQGGIAAVTSKDDAPEIHKDDTLIAGRGLCEESAVDILDSGTSGVPCRNRRRGGLCRLNSRHT